MALHGKNKLGVETLRARAPPADARQSTSPTATRGGRRLGAAASATARCRLAARRLLEPLRASSHRLIEPTASAVFFADYTASSTFSTARESAPLRREWTQRFVYFAAAEHDILCIATRTIHHAPPQLSASPAVSGGGGGDAEVDEERELLVAERLHAKSPPVVWLLRAVWNAGAHRFEERACRTGNAAGQIHEFFDECRLSCRGRRPALARWTHVLERSRRISLAVAVARLVLTS